MAKIVKRNKVVSVVADNGGEVKVNSSELFEVGKVYATLFEGIDIPKDPQELADLIISGSGELEVGDMGEFRDYHKSLMVKIGCSFPEVKKVIPKVKKGKKVQPETPETPTIEIKCDNCMRFTDCKGEFEDCGIELEKTDVPGETIEEEDCPGFSPIVTTSKKKKKGKKVVEEEEEEEKGGRGFGPKKDKCTPFWTILKENDPLTKGDMVELLIEEVDTTKAQAGRDIGRYIDLLVAGGILEEVKGGKFELQLDLD